MKGSRVAIFGATGAVGREVIRVLDQRKFQISELVLFASPQSVGKEITFQDQKINIRKFESSDNFKNLDFIFFTAGGELSKKYIPQALEKGAWVIDNSSFYRMDPEVPLIVPEVNGSCLTSKKWKSKLIANPNCTTAQLVMALKPLHDAFEIKRVTLSSYQAVSGRGQKGIDEFTSQIHAFEKNKKYEPGVFPHKIAFNCIPQIDRFFDDGFTGEELKVIAETKKILNAPEMGVMATCVRVPVMNGHSESISIETKREINPSSARAVLEKMQGVRVVDDPKLQKYPLAMDVSGTDDVLVGRIRTDLSLQSQESGRHGLSFWVVADNLRKGAALNAVQIAEVVNQHH